MMAKEIDADAIYVSKPRLPSYGLGILAKQLPEPPAGARRRRPRARVLRRGRRPRPARHCSGSRGDDDLTLPFGRSWTRACEPLIDAADAVTVSNVALAERFGGMIVPHARDERRLRPGAVRPERDATTPRRDGIRTAAALRRHAACAQGHRRGAPSPRAPGRRAVPRPAVRHARVRRPARPDRRARAVGPRPPVPALRRPAAPRRRGRPRVRAAGSPPPGLAVPASGQDHRRARDGRAVPRDAGTTAATAHRHRGGRGSRRQHTAARAHRDDLRPLRRRARPSPSGPRSCSRTRTATKR